LLVIPAQAGIHFALAFHVPALRRCAASTCSLSPKNKGWRELVSSFRWNDELRKKQLKRRDERR